MHIVPYMLIGKIVRRVPLYIESIDCAMQQFAQLHSIVSSGDAGIKIEEPPSPARGLKLAVWNGNAPRDDRCAYVGRWRAREPIGVPGCSGGRGAESDRSPWGYA